MGRTGVRVEVAAVAAGLALAALGAAPLAGAGFAIFEQGTRAMGTGMAFTGRADDPSTLFYNVGGLAFFDERDRSAGLTLITFSRADFAGGEPFPGRGVSEEQESLLEAVPHAYWVEPIRRDWNFGMALYTPFGLSTEWQDAAEFSGRYLSARAALRAVDLNPSLAWRVTSRTGIGFGVVFRFSDVELERFVPFVNPFTQSVVDVGRVELSSGFERGLGWNLGVLHQRDERLSFGFSYRSPIQVDYLGDARFTQIPTGIPPLDAAVAALIPFDRDLDVQTEIEFPASASAGVAVALSTRARLMVDVGWTGWSSFDRVPLTFGTAPQLSETLEQEWDDAMSYRAGLAWAAASGAEWRAGLVYDETPQPDEHVGPLLPDADRTGLTIGWGKRLRKTELDLALMYFAFDDRTTSTNADGFQGTYRTTAWLLGATAGF